MESWLLSGSGLKSINVGMYHKFPSYIHLYSWNGYTMEKTPWYLVGIHLLKTSIGFKFNVWMYRKSFDTQRLGVWGAILPPNLCHLSNPPETEGVFSFSEPPWLLSNPLISVLSGLGMGWVEVSSIVWHFPRQHWTDATTRRDAWGEPGVARVGWLKYLRTEVKLKST